MATEKKQKTEGPFCHLWVFLWWYRPRTFYKSPLPFFKLTISFLVVGAIVEWKAGNEEHEERSWGCAWPSLNKVLGHIVFTCVSFTHSVRSCLRTRTAKEEDTQCQPLAYAPTQAHMLHAYIHHIPRKRKERKEEGEKGRKKRKESWDTRVYQLHKKKLCSDS